MCRKVFRPIDLARMAGVSTQCIRQYEAWGFLPPSARTVSGHRQYTERHQDALQTARALTIGYGWPQALQIMKLIHADRLSEVLALIDKYHAEFHQERLHIAETLTALRSVADQAHRIYRQKEQNARLIYTGEAARQVGIPVSTVRFWEQQGLLAPKRDKTNNYRIYDSEQLFQLQVIALLRKAGYGFDAISPVLTALSDGRIDQAIHAAETRLQELDKTSYEAARGTALLWGYLKNYNDVGKFLQ